MVSTFEKRQTPLDGIEGAGLDHVGEPEERRRSAAPRTRSRRLPRASVNMRRELRHPDGVDQHRHLELGDRREPEPRRGDDDVGRVRERVEEQRRQGARASRARAGSGPASGPTATSARPAESRSPIPESRLVISIVDPVETSELKRAPADRDVGTGGSRSAPCRPGSADRWIAVAVRSRHLDRDVGPVARDVQLVEDDRAGAGGDHDPVLGGRRLPIDEVR